MTEKTQAWAERVGREAVELGMPCLRGMRSSHHGSPSTVEDGNGLYWIDDEWPDFRDRLTEMSCIAWVEDVARGVYGALAELDFESGGPASKSRHRVTVARGGTNVGDWRLRVDERAPTLAEACIAAVRAMKGEPC